MVGWAALRISLVGRLLNATRQVNMGILLVLFIKCVSQRSPTLLLLCWWWLVRNATGSEGLCVALIGSVCVDWRRVRLLAAGRNYHREEEQQQHRLVMAACLSSISLGIRQSRAVFAGTVSDSEQNCLYVCSSVRLWCRYIHLRAWHRSVARWFIHNSFVR